MTRPYSSTDSRYKGRSNILHHEVEDKERCEAVWSDLEGFVDFCDRHNMTREQTGCTVIFVETIAEQLAHNKTTIGGVEYDLILGHHHLNKRVSPRLLEQMEAIELIAPPTIMDGWTRKTKQQIARRALWDLGSTAKEYLDMSYIRGYAPVKRNTGPHAQEQDIRDLRGDPNESVTHKYFIRAGQLFYSHIRGYPEIRTYVRLGDITDVAENLANRRLDIVAYDDHGIITATAEAELHPLESDSVMRDAEAMALVPGDSDWIVYAKPQINDLLDTLDDQILTRPNEIPGWTKRRTSRQDALDRLQRVRTHPQGSVPSLESDVVSDVYSIDNLRAALKSNVPFVFDPIDPDRIVWGGAEHD